MGTTFPMDGPQLLKDVAVRWRTAMLKNNFEEAWRQTDRVEAIRRITGTSVEGSLLWDGSPCTGRSVVVRCLHGLGDTVQFLRFVPMLGAANVCVLAQPALVPLLRRASRIRDVRNAWTEFRIRGDVELEVMELAYAVRASPVDAAAMLPWLHPPRWSGPLPPSEPRVAVVWAASSWNPARSLPAAEVARLGRHIPCVSIQQDPGEDPLPSFARYTADPLDAASFLSSVDLLISVDTFAAHLAGSIGIPVWLLLEHEADWRWGSGQATPWYPSMKIFRQSARGDWRAVVDEVLAAFRSLR